MPPSSQVVAEVAAFCSFAIGYLREIDLGIPVRHTLLDGRPFAGTGVGSRLLAATIETSDNWFNVARIEVTVFTDNARAIALYEKFGFIIAGTHRELPQRRARRCASHGAPAA